MGESTPTPRVHKTTHPEEVKTYMEKGLKEPEERDVLRDPLTGFYNIRFLGGDPDHVPPLVGELVSLEKAAERSGRPLSAIMIDLDHFKNVNDTYGHEAGNLILQAVAKIILDHVRTTDRVIRYG